MFNKIFSKEKKQNIKCKYCGYTWDEQDKRSIISMLDLGPFCNACFDNVMKLKVEEQKQIETWCGIKYARDLTHLGRERVDEGDLYFLEEHTIGEHEIRIVQENEQVIVLDICVRSGLYKKNVLKEVK